MFDRKMLAWLGASVQVLGWDCDNFFVRGPDAELPLYRRR